MNHEPHDLILTIPLSGTDTQIRNRGYDLLEEYLRIIEAAGFDPTLPVLELATGPGRAAAILSRLGFRIISGDRTMAKAADLHKRVTPSHEHLLDLCMLDMAQLPFRTGSAHSILCLNTIHELEDPARCVNELVRVHEPGGTLVVSDFNELGFDIMQEIHLEVHGKDHARGPVSIDVLVPGLTRDYADVRVFETALNTSIICRGKHF